MPEPTVHESPSLASGGKTSYDQDGFLYLLFFSFNSSFLFQLFKTYMFLLVLPLLLSVPFLLPLLTTCVQAPGWKYRGICNVA